MAVFPKGREAISAAVAKSKSKGGYTPTFFWKSGEERIIQFITPIDEVCRVEHYGVKVGVSNSGGPLMKDFVDPRSIGIPDGYNPIAEREWDAGPVKPSTKLCAVVVELVEIGKGRNKTYEIATREYENSKGEDVEVPVVGVVIQSPTWWSWFENYADRKGVDLLGEAFSVERVENSSPVKYNAMQLDEGVELPKDVLTMIDMEAFLEELASEDHYREFIDPLGDKWILNSYAQKRGKKKDDEKPARQTRSRAARAAEENDDDGDADEDRAKGFADLKGEIEAEKGGSEIDALKKALGRK